jgi:hypothetical protein
MKCKINQTIYRLTLEKTINLSGKLLFNKPYIGKPNIKLNIIRNLTDKLIAIN